jgi:hypothetical protein
MYDDFGTIEMSADRGCQIFLGITYQKRAKIYQMTTEYIKIYQEGVKYFKWPNIYRLATLRRTQKRGGKNARKFAILGRRQSSPRFSGVRGSGS